MYKTITLNNLGELSPNLPKLKKLGASLYFLWTLMKKKQGFDPDYLITA
jgi:hypothetical protein